MKLLGLSKDFLPDRKVINCANLRNCKRKRTPTSTHPTILSGTEKGIQLNRTPWRLPRSGILIKTSHVAHMFSSYTERPMRPFLYNFAEALMSIFLYISYLLTRTLASRILIVFSLLQFKSQICICVKKSKRNSIIYLI